MLIIILIMASLLPFSASDHQGDALYDMKLKLNATDNQLSDWNKNQVNPCTWISVICDSNNNVVQVTLASMGFTGVLSPRIGELEYLNVFSLPGNKITGGIPEQFGNLSSLTSLDLEDNLLVGAIPASLGHLSKLQLLILSQNSLTGSIPDTLASISSLTDIRLAYNKLSGPIPGPLFQVARYNFSGNNLTCGTNFLHPCASNVSYQYYQETSHRSTGILLIVLIATGVATVVAVVAMLLSFLSHRRRRQNRRDVVDGMPGGDVYFEGVDHPNAEEDEDEESTSCQPYSYKILEAATCHFSNSNKLGSGGFGTVYRGTLENGKEVAVKRLKDSKRSLVELEREVSIVAKLRHQNIVRFLGYCFEDEGRLLVYEYLPNNSLDKFWNKGYCQCQRLDWATWFSIIKGVARGLQFLHDKGIIHRDLKPHNVLLDENFNPKIADFDLVRVYNKDRTHESTQKVAGTFGYMAPECTSGGKYQLSIKSDVYSYGVLVLEIVTGRKIHTFEGHNSEGLVEYVWQHWTKRRACDVVDSDLDVEAAEQGQRQALRCVHVALLCVQSDRPRRPTMGEVIAMVSTHQDSELQAPSLPGYLHPKSASGRALSPLPCFGCN